MDVDIYLSLTRFESAKRLKRIIFWATESRNIHLMKPIDRIHSRKLMFFLVLCLGLAMIAPVVVLVA